MSIYERHGADNMKLACTFPICMSVFTALEIVVQGARATT